MKTPTRIFAAIFTFLLLAVPAANAFDQSKVVNAVNQIRSSHGLPALQLHPALQQAAQQQSVVMAKTGTMKHTAARGYDFASRLRRVGYRGVAAENIARGQPTLTRVLSGWMNSKGHRRNMLHPRMRYFGLAVVNAGGRNYWAMVLGG